MTLPNTVPVLACPPGEEPLVWGLRSIEERADAAGWDQPNQVHFLFKTTSAGMPAIGVLGPALPEDLGKIHAADMLHLIATSIAVTGLPPNPPGDEAQFIGAAVLFECWSVQVDRNDPEAAAKADEDAAARRIADRPDAEETRIAILATIDGRQIVVARQRGHTPVAAAMEEESFDGRIADALGNLVRTCVIVQRGQIGRV